jgi:hypothetical protein
MWSSGRLQSELSKLVGERRQLGVGCRGRHGEGPVAERRKATAPAVTPEAVASAGRSSIGQTISATISAGRSIRISKRLRAGRFDAGSVDCRRGCWCCCCHERVAWKTYVAKPSATPAPAATRSRDPRRGAKPFEAPARHEG